MILGFLAVLEHKLLTLGFFEGECLDNLRFLVLVPILLKLVLFCPNLVSLVFEFFNYALHFVFLGVVLFLFLGHL